MTNAEKIMDALKENKKSFDKNMNIFDMGVGDSSAYSGSIYNPNAYDKFRNHGNTAVTDSIGPWISTGSDNRISTPEDAQKMWEEVSRQAERNRAKKLKLGNYKGISFRYSFSEESLQIIEDLNNIKKDEVLMIKILSPEEFNGILKAWKIAYQDFMAEKEFFKGD